MCESEDDSSDRDELEGESNYTGSRRNRQRGGFKRGNYARIPDKTRAELIKLVVEEGLGVVKATAKLGIKYTTGKHIVRRYMRTGHFADKRFKHTSKHLNSQTVPRQVESASPKGQFKPLNFKFDLRPEQKVGTPPAKQNIPSVAEWMA